MDLSYFISLKGEFEAEGLPRDTVAAEAAFAAQNGLPYLVKIGGCEAKSDMRFCSQVGIRSIVAPMIESAFAMSKYMQMLDRDAFDHAGVTIETVTAVDRIEAILDAGTALTDVTVGRTDLTASYDGPGVDSDETVAMVKTVLKAARARGLGTTMGGSVGAGTLALLRRDEELRELLDHVETRKCIMPVDQFLRDGALDAAFAVECALLDRQQAFHGAIHQAASSRVTQIRARV